MLTEMAGSPLVPGVGREGLAQHRGVPGSFALPSQGLAGCGPASAKMKAGIFTRAERISTRLRTQMPLGLLDNPTLMTLKGDGLVPVADTFPAEPLWSLEGDLQPHGIHAGPGTAAALPLPRDVQTPAGSVARPQGRTQRPPVPLASPRHSSPCCPSLRAVGAEPDLIPTGATGPGLRTRVLGGRGHRHARRPVMKNSSFKSPSKGNNGLRFIFLVLQKLL